MQLEGEMEAADWLELHYKVNMIINHEIDFSEDSSHEKHHELNHTSPFWRVGSLILVIGL